MKAFTDIEQSKKLATILPIDSADMWWDWFGNPLDDVNDGEYSTEPLLHKPVSNPRNIIPCWSLAALTNVMRLDYYIVRTLDILTHRFTYSIHAGYFDIETDEYDELIDGCVEMITKLKEKDLI